MSPLDGWHQVPLEVAVDLQLGGRWTSLRCGSREWLWHNPDDATQRARRQVRPGEPFVDAGGVEECFPTVRGVPDHGDIWSRPWVGAQIAAAVNALRFGRMQRTMTSSGELEVRYQVDAAPGHWFLHAVHALIDVSESASLVAPGVAWMTVLDVHEPEQLWPSGLDRLGPDDGSAVCALLPGCSEAIVIDGNDALRLRWESPQQPDACSLLLWRNLRGWPAGGPYRSVGIEPMVGRAADLASALPSACARLDADGHFRWTLRLAAYARRPTPTRTHFPS